MIDLAALNFAKTQAEIELLKSQANKNNVEAGYTGGAKTDETKTNIDLLRSQITNNEAKTALTKAEEIGKTIENEINNATALTRVKTAEEQLHLYGQQVKNAITNNGILLGQAESLIQQKTNEVALQLVQKRIMESQVKLTEAQTNNLLEGIKQKWSEINQKNVQLANDKRSLDQKDATILIDRQRANYENMLKEADIALKKWQQEHPSASQAIGGVYEDLRDFFNGDPRIWK